jgi:hypothetical protein
MTPRALARFQFPSDRALRRKILANDVKYLHDPARFGIDTEEITDGAH